MAAEWTTSRFEELSINFDGKRRPVKESDRRPGPFPYYGASGIVDHVDDYLFDGKYLLIAEDGENLRTRQTPIAFLASGKFWVNNHAHIVTGNERADTSFLMYALRHIGIDAYLTGAVMPKLTQGNLNRIEVTHPPIREQRAIAGVLGALDDKIEQNRRTARELERLAQAIFRAWFVDFDPVKVKAAGAAAFPSMPQHVFDVLPTRFVNSEFGAMPEGWQRSTIGDSANHVAMGPFGSDIKTDNFVAEGVPVIRGGNLTDGFVDEDFVYLTEAKADQLSNANAFPGDLVITHRGTLGQVGLIPARSRHRRYVVSQSQMLIRPNAELLPRHFLYLFLTSPAGQHELLANRSQTGVPAISRPTTSVKAIRVVVPAQTILLHHFESIASTLFDGLAVIGNETRKLAQMRDYLLPKLMSGQVRVESARG